MRGGVQGELFGLVISFRAATHTYRTEKERVMI